MRDWVLDFEGEITEWIQEILDNPEFDHSRISLYVDDNKHHYSIFLPLSELIFSPEEQPDLTKDGSSRDSHQTWSSDDNLDASYVFESLYNELF